MKFLTPFLFETPEAGSGAAEPVAEQPVVAASPVTPTPGDAPWSADLPTYFQDEAARAAADRYLREKHQPYVTQLQQQVAEAAPARQLYEGFLESPNETLLEVASELYGDEVAGKFQALLEAGVEPEAAAAAAVEAAPQPAVDPRLEEMWAEREAQRHQAAYEAELARVQGEHPTVDAELFAPHVVANSGDFDKALASYKIWEANVAAKYGGTPAEAHVPAVLGSGGSTGVQPQPIEQKYGSLDDALDATLAEMRAAREAPTVVGSV